MLPENIHPELLDKVDPQFEASCEGMLTKIRRDSINQGIRMSDATAPQEAKRVFIKAMESATSAHQGHLEMIRLMRQGGATEEQIEPLIQDQRPWLIESLTQHGIPLAVATEIADTDILEKKK